MTSTDPMSSGRPDPDDGGGAGASPATGEVRGTGEREAGDEVSDLGLDTYQEGALETALFPDIGGERCIYPALGLANEAGEVLGKIKKLYRDGDGRVTPEFRRVVKKELGDVLWYVAVLADAFDLRVSEVAEANLEKLADRARRDAIRGSGDER